MLFLKSLLVVFAPLVATSSAQNVTLTKLATFDSGAGVDNGGAEIVDFDPTTNFAFITNGNDGAIDVVDFGNIRNPRKVTSLFLADGFVPTSVKVLPGARLVVAAGTDEENDANPGIAQFFEIQQTGGIFAFLSFLFGGSPQTEFEDLGTITVGSLPDAVTASPDENTILLAIEGEPVDDVDPKGGIALIDISNGARFAIANSATTLTTLEFDAFDDQVDTLRSNDIRVFPDKVPSIDWEPEFIAVSDDSTLAFVALQEANAFARVDLVNKEILDVVTCGLQDYGTVLLDPSDRDGGYNPKTLTGLFGLLQPDTIASYTVNGEPFFVSANEGDARGVEEDRLKDLTLDPSLFPDASTIQQDENFGRLEVSNLEAEFFDNDQDLDQILTFGGRSFSIYDAEGNQVFDSGSDFERITFEILGDDFNNNNDENEGDTRSDAKGPEPEALAIGTIGSRTFAFVGLERVGGIIVYDITVPQNSFFVTYFNDRNFDGAIDADNNINEAGDLGPESIKFVSANDAPLFAGNLIFVANEISGTTSVFRVNVGNTFFGFPFPFFF